MMNVSTEDEIMITILKLTENVHSSLIIHHFDLNYEFTGALCSALAGHMCLLIQPVCNRISGKRAC
jgi:hypothetical protein